VSLYESLIRPIMFSLDPETAHSAAELALRASGRVPGAGRALAALFASSDPALETTVAGLRFPNPVGLAAGFDKDCRMAGLLPALGFGFIELGSVTLRPQPGNPRPRLMRLPLERALINRMGFPGAGAQAAARRLQAAGRCAVPVGVNIGLNADTPKASAPQEYAEVLSRLHPYASYFVVNVSCPNMTGLRDLQERLQRRHAAHEEIVLPEGGPRRDYQHETGLQEVRREQQTGDHCDDQPPVCTRARRSARAATSRYSPASACSSRNTASARAHSPTVSSMQPRSYNSARPSSASGAGSSLNTSLFKLVCQEKSP